MYEEGLPLIYEEMRKYFPIHMRRPLVIYDFATAPLWISLLDEENLNFFFISAPASNFFSLHGAGMTLQNAAIELQMFSSDFLAFWYQHNC
jgi:hypothetical protein